MKWRVWAPPFDPHSGGNVVLYKLAALLRETGEEVAVSSGGAGSADAVAVYPEVVVGNPFGARRVVRWCLNKPGLLGGDGVFAPSDLIFLYWPAFRPQGACTVAGSLMLHSLDAGVFTNQGQPRSGTCYLIRKGAMLGLSAPAGALVIDDFPSRGGDRYLAEVFNRHERLISYDHATFISVMALLCGCESIVAPLPDMSREEWQAGHTLLSGCGVKYGEDDPSPNRAAEYLAALARSERAQVKALIAAVKSISPGGTVVRHHFTRDGHFVEQDGVLHPYDPANKATALPCRDCGTDRQRAAAAIWGPPMWRELHARPSHPGYDPTSELAWLKEHFAPRIPCDDCRAHFLNDLQSTPPMFTSPKAYSAWITEEHVEVNRRRDAKPAH